MKRIILLLFIIVSFRIYSKEIKAEIIFDEQYHNYKNTIESFDFYDKENIIMVLSSENSINILNIYNNNIIIINKGHISDFSYGYIKYLNNKILFFKDIMIMENNEFKGTTYRLCFYDLDTLSTVDIHDKFKVADGLAGCYWDYYGNNKKIIFQYRKLLNWEYYLEDCGISRLDLSNNSIEEIKKDVYLVDYNKGLLLYYKHIRKKNWEDWKIYLFDDKKKTTIYLDKLPPISFPERINDKAKFYDLKIYKNSNYLVKTTIQIPIDKKIFKDGIIVSNILHIINEKTGEITDIKIKDNMYVLDYKYSFDEDLIAILYNGYKDVKKWFGGIKKEEYKGLMVIKIDF